MKNTGERRIMRIITCPIPFMAQTLRLQRTWFAGYGSIIIITVIYFHCSIKRILLNLFLGGGWTRYDGSHYGNIIWAQNGLPEPDFKWYDLNSKKTDANIYFQTANPGSQLLEFIL